MQSKGLVIRALNLIFKQGKNLKSITLFYGEKLGFGFTHPLKDIILLVIYNKYINIDII